MGSFVLKGQTSITQMNFYFEAAKTLERLDAKRGSIKGVLAGLPEKNRKRTAALVIETLKYKSVLTEVINASKILQEERKKITSLNLALVLVHDILLSGGIEASDGPVKQAVLRHKTRLHGEFQRVKIKRGVKSDVELAQSSDHRAARIPRYVRVNTAMWTAEQAIQSFISHGFDLSGPFHSRKGFAKDDHVPDLLLFPPETNFLTDEAYKTGKIILQDKASCFPAVVLDPPAVRSSMVIDATAAPGNKTSHLSALMGNKGKLFAFERDRKRFATLQMMISKAGCQNVEPINADFLTVDPTDPKYAATTHILLDPSCSGSGIVSRLDHLETEEENEAAQEQRLAKLAGFQLSMVKHAFKFPSVKRIVYSTCSIHAVENEHVVRDALRSDEARAGNFRLAPANKVLPTWHRRGLSAELDSAADASALVRCLPGEDATNGFFVSCFIKHEDDVNHDQPSKRKTGEGDRPRKRKKKKTS